MMTPEQRAARQAQMEKARWDWVHQTFIASGLTDATLQDSVVTAMQAKEKSRAALQDQARNLASLLINKDTKDADISAALKAYRAAVLADKAIYTDLLTDVEAKNHYTTTPRLETLLTVLGVLGDETAYLGGLGELFPDSPMGRRQGFGGRGGQGGGGQGGGGQGGGGQGGGGQGGGGQGGRGGRRGGQGGGGQGGGGNAGGGDMPAG